MDSSAQFTRLGVQQRTRGADTRGMHRHIRTYTGPRFAPHPNDRIAMALHLSRGFTSVEGVEGACRFFHLDDASVAEVLDIWRARQPAERRAPDSPMRDPHPGRQCSSDCAEFGCASWTACDPRP